MIIRANQNPPREVNQLHDGIGPTIFHPIVGKDDLPPNCKMFTKLVLPPGATVGEHAHENECEFFYFLTAGQVLDDGKPVDVAPGDTMITGHGHSHAVINNGNEPLEYLAIIVSGVSS